MCACHSWNRGRATEVSLRFQKSSQLTIVCFTKSNRRGDDEDGITKNTFIDLQIVCSCEAGSTTFQSRRGLTIHMIFMCTIGEILNTFLLDLSCHPCRVNRVQCCPNDCRRNVNVSHSSFWHCSMTLCQIFSSHSSAHPASVSVYAPFPVRLHISSNLWFRSMIA